MSYDIKMISKT